MQQNKSQTPAAGQAGEANADFMATNFMQQNVENNVAFENQLRWDPIKKAYRQIGQIESDYGYLPNAEKKPMTQKERNKLNKKRRRQAEQAQAEQQATQTAQQTASPYTGGGSISGNFNTATG